MDGAREFSRHFRRLQLIRQKRMNTEYENIELNREVNGALADKKLTANKKF